MFEDIRVDALVFKVLLTADKYDDAVRGASALPTVKDVRRTVMQASSHVIVECWNRSVHARVRFGN